MGHLVLGNTFCKSLFKFMASFNVVGLWDFTSPLKGYVNPLVKSKTNLAIDTSETITESFSNSNIYASGVPTCFNCASSLKGSSVPFLSNILINALEKPHKIKHDHVPML